MSQDRMEKPEDHELQLKRKELLSLESQLADKELELATMQGSLHAFERRSKAELDPRYEELAELQAKIGELLSRIRPASAEPQKSSNAASAARTPKVPRKHRPRPAHPGDRNAQPAPPAAPQQTFSPGEQLKRLYRDVAKAVHPDLAEDDIERQHRHTLMVKANEAYDAGDDARLTAILNEWESSPEAIRGQGTILDLVRCIRRIHRCRRRLGEISQELARLTGTSLFNLKNMADAAQDFERDLLSEMTGRLDIDLAQARQQLAELEKLVPTETPPPEASPPASDLPLPQYEPMYIQTFPEPTREDL